MQRDAAGRRDVRDAGSQARGQRMQHVFYRCGTIVLAAQHRWMVRVGGVGCLMTMLSAGAGEVRHRGTHMGATQPLAVGPELEGAELGLILDDVYCGEQGGRMDTIEGYRDPF